MATSFLSSSAAHLLCPSPSRSEPHRRRRRRRLPIPLPSSRARSPLRASRRLSNYPQDAVVVLPDPHAWVGGDGLHGGDDDVDEEEEEEEDDDDRSLDLLARFLENAFRKISRRARRAVRSVLPYSISSKLVRFAVNGVLVLTFLWILKGLLEVVCTFGSMAFVSILLVRGIWSGVSYINWSRYHYSNRTEGGGSQWNGVQTAT